ncbi:MAG: SAM-dependent methyltransferase [Lachnospiraceae bacterium]
MSNFSVHPIGRIRNGEAGTIIEVEKEYWPALLELEGFSHINVLWWFSNFDDAQFRSTLQTERPYKGAPAVMGIFSTRSPVRPNPIALTAAEVIRIDHENGLIHIAYIDADDNTPVLDIKPYTPSLDRIEAPQVPAWCAHWPKSMEESASFAWENEFLF